MCTQVICTDATACRAPAERLGCTLKPAYRAFQQLAGCDWGVQTGPRCRPQRRLPIHGAMSAAGCRPLSWVGLDPEVGRCAADAQRFALSGLRLLCVIASGLPPPGSPDCLKIGRPAPPLGAAPPRLHAGIPSQPSAHSHSHSRPSSLLRLPNAKLPNPKKTYPSLPPGAAVTLRFPHA